MFYRYLPQNNNVLPVLMPYLYIILYIILILYNRTHGCIYKIKIWSKIHQQNKNYIKEFA